MMGKVLRLLDDAFRRFITDVTEGDAAPRRLALALYLVLAPVGVLGSLVLTHNAAPAQVVAKVAVYAAAILWIWRRPELTRVELIVLFALVPALGNASSSWVAGIREDAPFYFAGAALVCIVAAVFEYDVVITMVVAELVGFLVVQLHVESTGDAVAATVIAGAVLILAAGMIYSIARAQRGTRRELQTLIDQLPGAIFRFDARRREMLYASPQVELLTGESAEWWIGPEGYERWSSAMVNPTHPDWEELGRSGMPWQNEYQWRRPDGELRTFRSITRIVAPGVVQSLVVDATEEAAAEQALQLEQRRYRALVEQMPAAVVRASAEGVVEYVSPQVEQQLGLTPAEFMVVANSPDWLDVIHPDDRERVSGFYAAERRAGDPAEEFEARVRASDDSYRTVLVRRAKLDDPEGGAYFHSVMIDITDVRAAEARSRQALGALVRASEEEQARLAVELHDDTVQVLTAVLLQLHRVQRDNPVVSEAATMLEGAIERTRRLMFELRPEVLEREGLGAALARVTRDGPWSRAQIDIAIPRQSDTVEALCYRTLRELVINARKHSNADNLRITGREADGRLRLSVEDDGEGFEPLEALAHDDDDLHIGLRTVVERVRMAGGEVEVTSSPGSGTRVGVTLPAEPRDPATADTAA